LAGGHLPAGSEALTAVRSAPPRATETDDAGKPAPKNRRRIQAGPEELGREHREREQYRRGVLGARVGSEPSIRPVLAGCARWSMNDRE
jgi:hypothetical protein